MLILGVMQYGVQRRTWATKRVISDNVILTKFSITIILSFF